jgi:hypothetical protein
MRKPTTHTYNQFFETYKVVDSSVGRGLSHSHEGPRFKSQRGHLFGLLLICDLIDCLIDEHKWSIDLRRLLINAGAHRSDDQNS